MKKQGPGGANRDRTGDLLLAKQALSQLSYGPGTSQILTSQITRQPNYWPDRLQRASGLAAQKSGGPGKI